MKTTEKTCIIHIGMHKTGTTSLQVALKGYDDGATHYADLGPANHSMPLVTLFMTNPENYGIHKQWGRTPEQIARMKADFAARLDDTIAATKQRMILSGEGLSLRLGAREVARMTEYLRAHFDRIGVVAYVRDFASFAASSFQQQVKSGKNSFEVPRIVYRKRFQGWRAATAPGELTFLPYAGGTVEDFFDRYGLDKPQSAAKTRNDSLSAPALALLFAYNHAVGDVLGSPRKARAYKSLVSYLNTLEGAKFSFAPEVFKAAHAENAADIAWMERAAGFPVSGALKPQPHVFGSASDILALARESRGMIDTADPAGAQLHKALENL